MAELSAKLEEEYCPPLDPALLSAILSDYDLTDERQLQAARATLEPLKESATAEEELGFDASGTGARDGDLGYVERVQSSTEASDLRSSETDMTSLSNAVNSLHLEIRPQDIDVSDPNLGGYESVEDMDEEKKVDLLLKVVSGFTRHHALYTLRKCKGNWHRAFEEMLTHAYFVEAEHSDDGTKIVAKGIDAFSEDNQVNRGRKGKAKKRNMKYLEQRSSSSSPWTPEDSSAPPGNKWQTSSEDIEFLATRMNMSRRSVAPIFYSHGASLPRTISAILKNSLQNEAPTEDPIIVVNAHELRNEFPSISLEYATALSRATYPSTAAAHEVAKVLTARPRSAGGIQIIPKYVAPNLEDNSSRWTTMSKPDRPAQYLSETSDTFDATSQAHSYAAARSAALAQAYAAHRKAKSDRLMGGAAAYYGEVSRDMAARSSRAAAMAADQVSASQSSKYQIDLHGIDVLNAVRIAQEKVEQWWDGLGEHRANGRLGATERQAGYTIVVGRGIHSEGGKSKLSPAVSKMLKNEGWKYETSSASIVVKGRART